MKRRAYSTFEKNWHDKDVIVTSPKISVVRYPTKDISMETVINIMVGDLHQSLPGPGLPGFMRNTATN